MKTTERWYSDRMKQEISFVRWGHFGTPVLVFPTAGGDAEEIERHHLLAHLGELVEAGRIKVYSCDSLAGRAMATDDGTVEYRCWLFNQFQQAVAHEMVPAIHADVGGPQDVIVAGASIGAFNSCALICRWPQLFRAAICMSGTYDVERFVGGFTDDLYFASPLHFLPGNGGTVARRAPAAVRLPALRLRQVGGHRRVVAGGQGAGREGRSQPGRRLGARLRPRLAHVVEACCRRTSSRPCPREHCCSLPASAS